MKNYVVLLILALITSTIVAAQTYEIRAVNKGNGYVGVEMRATSGTPPTTSNFVTDIVFGLKWLTSYNVDLVNSITTSYNIIKSDVRKTNGAYYFQAFSAANTPFAFPSNWTLNNWVEIMSVRNTMTGTGTGTFEVTEPGFDLSTEPNFGIDLTDFTPTVAGSATNVPLPVKLNGFDAVPKKSQIVLNWNTEYELNSKTFEVERSEDGSSSFKKIGTVNSKSQGTNVYEWVDKEVTVATKYLYRLKMVDMDNKYQYSITRTAQLEEKDIHAIHIMPNPTDKMLQVVFGSGLNSGKVTIKIIDANGVVVMKKNHDLGAERNATFNVFALASGQYYLSVEDNKGFLYTKTFIKK
jgi:hypothetical protein